MLYTITMGYCPGRIWENSAQAYYRLCNRNTEHVFVDQCYPLNKIQNQRDNWNVCRDLGISVLFPGKNLGSAEGFNYALRRLPLKPDDVVIGYDPDSWPISPGFDGALEDIFAIDKKVVWASLLNEPAKTQLLDGHYTKRMANQLELWRPNHAVVNSVCAFRAGWLLDHGGFVQPGPYYGGLEIAMWPRLDENHQWVFLPGWQDTDDLKRKQDREYRDWKWWYSYKQQYRADFEQYIKDGCPSF